MQIGMPINYAGGFAETVEELRDFEAAGLDLVSMPEVYTYDAVSQLGYIAAKTSTVKIASGILNIYTRTPTLLGMTAAGLDYVSGGRFMLGIGASGPQVIEGFHGVAYDAPVGRMREVVQVCRKVWRREMVEFDGRHYHLPLTPEHGGSGAGKALRLINHPVRGDIPVVLAALGPKSVELAAELFDGWQPIFYFPERAEAVYGESLAAGRAKRDPAMGPLDIIADTTVAITDDPAQQEAARAVVRGHLALYIGGMGSRKKNFYNDLAVRYGYDEAAATIQDLYLSGRKEEAAAAVPTELVDGICLIGPLGHVQQRLDAYREHGVSTLSAVPIAPTHEGRVKTIAALKDAAS
ncbi:MAG TPA: LLM class F420-dependent oxidoreductase [Dermatophilaceae bacterium]|nr:LLM class F420-dependent oxidoreductase [Dermatophilaceae bacterium]